MSKIFIFLYRGPSLDTIKSQSSKKKKKIVESLQNRYLIGI